ncbi:unnamed protein product [Microthlaspi erraticum]|uniref:Replication factor A C-terminal domain-containing protein n=1 Tax=Microthlaspi erraticum TaxID=1685480 RepID=A0A6D2HRS9_9BRAS|nr:unnamed protein product [Microthlaspi erraticum]
MVCSKCLRKLLRGISTFTCTVCHDLDAVALNRYRVAMVFSDGNNTAVFVGFDTDMTKLTNMTASAAITTANNFEKLMERYLAIGNVKSHYVKSIQEGEADEGRAYIDKLQWAKNKSTGDRCWTNFKRSLQAIPVLRNN